MIFHRLIRRLVYSYIRKEESITNNKVKQGSNSKISYPCILEHEELIVIGNNTRILDNARLQLYPEYVQFQPHIQIGDNCLIGYRFCVLAAADVDIGDNVLMASDVTIVSHNHGIDLKKKEVFMDQPLTVAPVKIGNNVWIGDKVIILPGVEIGDNVVIGAGAVVTKDIPSNSIGVGNPMKIIKKFDDQLQKWIKQ